MKAVGLLAILSLSAITWGINEITPPNHHLHHFHHDVYLLPSNHFKIINGKLCNNNNNINNNNIDDNNNNDIIIDNYDKKGQSSSSKYISELDNGHIYDWAGVNVGTDFSPDNPVDYINNYKKQNLEKRTSTTNSNQELLDLFNQQSSSCACQTKYELFDLGYTHFPRYLVNAVCQHRATSSRKCWRGSKCKEIPYKVRVLTHRSESDKIESDILSSLLPDALRNLWKFKTITVAAACQCAV